MDGIQGLNTSMPNYGQIASGKRINSAADDAAGLAIAQEIVNLHKVKISLESELGKGTKFIVELKTRVK